MAQLICTALGTDSLLIEIAESLIWLNPNLSQASAATVTSKTISAACLSKDARWRYSCDGFCYLPSETPVIARTGRAKKLARFVGNPISELELWASYQPSNNCKITLTPGGFMVEQDDICLLLADENSAKLNFSEIANSFNVNSVAIAITHSKIDSFLHYAVSENRAVEICEQVNGKHLLVMHTNTWTAKPKSNLQVHIPQMERCVITP